jgi:hypothetical protein
MWTSIRLSFADNFPYLIISSEPGCKQFVLHPVKTPEAVCATASGVFEKSGQANEGTLFPPPGMV